MPFSGHKGGNGGSRREAAEPLRSQCQHGGDLGKLLSPERPLCRQAARRERLGASNCLAPTLTQRYRHDRQPAGAQGCLRSRIGARGATIRYLPKYSPDLNRSRCLSANSRPICARPPVGSCRACAAGSAGSQPPSRPAKRFQFAPYRRFRSFSWDNAGAAACLFRKPREGPTERNTGTMRSFLSPTSYFRSRSNNL
jgi:hypothetical protein